MEEITEVFKVAPKDITIEEIEGIQGQVLGTGGDVPFGHEISQKITNLRYVHFCWIAHIVVTDEPLDPIQVLFEAFWLQWAEGGGGSDLFEEFWVEDVRNVCQGDSYRAQCNVLSLLISLQ
jgi:hypothetical protein